MTRQPDYEHLETAEGRPREPERELPRGHWFLAPVCRLLGHENVGTFLPEDPFGLYAYSRLWCRRCGRVDAERPIEEQIEVLMGYVTLWNDVRPIVDAARAFMGEPSAVGWDYPTKGDPGPALNAALRRYESLYPEHLR